MPINLFDLNAAINIVDADDVVYVKGFASAEIPDREREIAIATEFDIPTFLATSGTLLVNHKPLKDEFGNETSAGKVERANAVYISNENPENPAEWVVKDAFTDEFVDVHPKAASPNLSVGDRGLFVVARVSHPKTIEKVRKGDLRSFSWRGFSMRQVLDNSLKRLLQIDLAEISLVDIPCQNQSNFVSGEMISDGMIKWQEVDIAKHNIYKFRFSKMNYSPSRVKEYLKAHNIQTDTLAEDGNFYYADVGEPSLLEVSKSIAIPVGDMCAIAAPISDDAIKMSRAEFVGEINTNPLKGNEHMSETTETVVEKADAVQVEAQNLYLLDLESIKSAFPNAVIELQNESQIGEMPVKIHSLEIPIEVETETEKSEATVEAVAEEVEAVEAEAISDETSKNAELTSRFDKIEQVLEILLAEKQAKVEAEAALATEAEIEAKVQEKVEAEKSAILEALKANDAALKANEDQKANLAKQLEAFNSFVPAQNAREERVETSKSAPESVDVFSIFKTVKS